MRLLIVRLSSLGDVACSLPAAACLADAFADAEIVWAVDPRFAGVPECCPFVTEVARVKPKLAPSTWPRFEGEFDAVLDLQALSKSAIVAAGARSNLKLGYHWQREFSWLVSRPVEPDPRSIHVVDQYVDVARATIAALGASPGEGRYRLIPKIEDVDAVRGRLAERGIEGPYALLNPGAGWASKRWPAASFARVADWLRGRGIAPVVLGGNAPADHAAFEEVASTASRQPIKMTGATSVRELVALVAGAQAHIGGDTGSTHLAAALAIPAIGLYSITRPERSCPYGQLHNTLHNPVSLAEIAPEAAIEKLEAVLRP